MERMERTRLLNWEKWPDEWEYVLWATMLDRPFTPEEEAHLAIVVERLWPGQNGRNRRPKYQYIPKVKKVYKITYPDGEFEIFRNLDDVMEGIDITRDHLRDLLKGTYVYKKRRMHKSTKLYKDFTGYTIERIDDPNGY